MYGLTGADIHFCMHGVHKAHWGVTGNSGQYLAQEVDLCIINLSKVEDTF